MSRHWFPHYPGDYIRSTGHLSLVEDGAYRRLLDHYYSTEKPLSTDLSQLHRICRAVSAEEQAAVDTVIQQFFVISGGFYHNKRADRELVRAECKSNKSRAAAKARWEKDANAHADAYANGYADRYADGYADGYAEHMPPQPQPQPHLDPQPKESNPSDSRLVNAGKEKTPPPKPSPSPKKRLALELCKDLLTRMGEATGRKLISKPSGTDIEKLLADGVSEQDIRATIQWLATDNQKRECKFVVLSGKSLRAKWDKLQEARVKPKAKASDIHLEII